VAFRKDGEAPQTISCWPKILRTFPDEGKEGKKVVREPPGRKRKAGREAWVLTLENLA